jgi:hypothetical protein
MHELVACTSQRRLHVLLPKRILHATVRLRENWGPEMGLPRQSEDPSLNPPCRIQGPKLGSNELLYSVSTQDALTPAQPQLRP